MKVAIVTGASSGIGLAIAQALANRGYALVVNARTLTDNHPSLAAIGAKDMAAVPGDIGNQAVAQRAVETAIAQFGHIDLVVNNAGIFIPKSFTEYTQDDFINLLHTNLGGFFHLSQAAVPHMKERGRGHIVTITTSLAENPLKAVSSVLPILTKGGLNAATRALALELAGTGVRVNAIAPGIIKTPMHDEQQYPFLATLHPMGRMGEPEEVAQALLYLEDAAFVTGDLLHVDGGAYFGHW